MPTHYAPIGALRAKQSAAATYNDNENGNNGAMTMTTMHMHGGTLVVHDSPASINNEIYLHEAAPPIIRNRANAKQQRASMMEQQRRMRQLPHQSHRVLSKECANGLIIGISCKRARAERAPLSVCREEAGVFIVSALHNVLQKATYYANTYTPVIRKRTKKNRYLCFITGSAGMIAKVKSHSKVGII